MQGVGAGHININCAEHALGCGEKVTVGFIHQTIIRQDIGHPKLHSDAPGLGVCYELELIMAHGFMAGPKPREHRGDLRTPDQMHLMGLNGKDTVRRKRAEHQIHIFTVDPSKIRPHHRFKHVAISAHGPDAAMGISFQICCEVIRPAVSEKRSMKRILAKSVPSCQTPDNVP